MKGKKMLCLFLVCAFFFALSGAVFAEGDRRTEEDAPMPPSVEIISMRMCVFGNGTSITVENGSTSEMTMIRYREGSDLRYVNFGTEAAPVYEADLRDLSVYGGKHGGKAKAGRITMTGGSVGCIFGGGYGSGSSVEETSVEIYAGEVSEVYGGGEESSVVLGSTEVYFSGGKVMSLVGGGAGESPVKGDTKVTLGGDVRVPLICGGGGFRSYVEGDSWILLKEGYADYIFGGGFKRAHVLGTSHIAILDAGFKNFAGGGVDSTCEVGATDIFISDRAVCDGCVSVDGTGLFHAKIKGKRNGVILHPSCRSEGFEDLLYAEERDGQFVYLTKGQPVFPNQEWTVPENSKFYVNRNTSLKFSKDSKIELKGLLKSYGDILLEGRLKLLPGAKVILAAPARMEVMKRGFYGKIEVLNGANFTVDPGAVLRLLGSSMMTVAEGGYFRVFEEGRFYWKDSANMIIKAGATIRGKLSTPPHELDEDQLSCFLVADLKYTGEDLKDKVEPNYRGLKFDLSDHAERFERRTKETWQPTEEVRELGEYRVIYRKEEKETSFPFRIRETDPGEPFALKMTPEGSWNFGEAEVGYGDLGIPVIYENIGTRDIPDLQTVLDCEPAGCFETSVWTLPEVLRVGERVEDFVRPRTGLPPGTYRGILKVFSEGKVERKLQLSFTVKKASPTPPTPPIPPDPPPTPELPIDEPYRVWSEQNDVATDKEWHIAFSRAVDPASVDEAKIFIVRADRVHQPLGAEIRISEDGKTVHIRAKERYRKGMKYYLIIQKIRTVDGTVLKENILMPFVIAS